VLQPAQPSLSQPSLATGGFSIQVGGDAGPDYSVYAATNPAENFTDWNWLVTSNPATLPFQFLDPAATNYSQRFYRVIIGP